MKWKKIIFPLLMLITGMPVHAQGFLHASGKNIVDGGGENFIIRGIGTGNWMIQEGYMMQTWEQPTPSMSSEKAGTDHWNGKNRQLLQCLAG